MKTDRLEEGVPGGVWTVGSHAILPHSSHGGEGSSEGPEAAERPRSWRADLEVEENRLELRLAPRIGGGA